MYVYMMIIVILMILFLLFVLCAWKANDDLVLTADVVASMGQRY
jgi:hypothetical protein